MKVSEALFREPHLAYQVALDSFLADDENPDSWNLLPLSGRTLAQESVEGPFEGLILPVRISEHHFVIADGKIARRRGRRTKEGTVIPAIGIEKRGVYTLYHAPEDPLAGIRVLQQGIDQASQKGYLEWDLAYLLRDQKMYREAIDAFSQCLAEFRESEAGLAGYAYQERSRLYSLIGEKQKAEEDKRLSALAFEKHR
jgi:tetratricopeptide (TPR) repeat protein